MSTTKDFYLLESLKTHLIISFRPELNDTDWDQIEHVGQEIVGRLNQIKSPHFLVDLSALNYMGSALVALIVRIWKSAKKRDGQMVVINHHEMVYDVLNIAGLTKVWNIVSDRKEALEALGVKHSANTQTKKILLIMTGLIAILISTLGTFPEKIPLDFLQQQFWADLCFFLGGGIQILVGVLIWFLYPGRTRIIAFIFCLEIIPLVLKLL